MINKFFYIAALSLNIGTSSLTLATDEPDRDCHRHTFIEEKLIYPRASDTRYRIGMTQEWPNCLFGQVTTSLGTGSGTLVGPGLVLTAAHMIYDRNNNTEATLDSIQFCPAKNGEITPYGTIEVSHMYYPEEYQRDDISSQHDWALLTLKTEIGRLIQERVQQQGWFDLRVCTDAELEYRPIHITGYPGEKLNELWEVTGNVICTENNIIYMLDTTPGQSGCAIWTEFNGRKYIIGSHTCGTVNFNFANRWTLDKHNKYNEVLLRSYQYTNLSLDKSFKYELASKYYYGNGIRGNWHEALYWYHDLAWNHGEALAKFMVGEIYHLGKKDFPDPNGLNALYYYIKSAEQGHEGARSRLAELADMYYYGNGREKNWHIALDLYRMYHNEAVANRMDSIIKFFGSKQDFSDAGWTWSRLYKTVVH